MSLEGWEHRLAQLEFALPTAAHTGVSKGWPRRLRGASGALGDVGFWPPSESLTKYQQCSPGNGIFHTPDS